MKTITDFEGKNTRVTFKIYSKNGKLMALKEIIWPSGGSTFSNPNYSDRMRFDTEKEALAYMRKDAKEDIASEYSTFTGYLTPKGRRKWEPLLEYAELTQKEPKPKDQKPTAKAGEQASLF